MEYGAGKWRALEEIAVVRLNVFSVFALVKAAVSVLRNLPDWSREALG